MLAGCSSLTDVGGSPAPAATSVPVMTSDAGPSTTAGTPAPSSPAADTDSIQSNEPVDAASVQLTFVEWSVDEGAIEAAAFVNGLVESGGTCVLVASAGGGELTGDPQPAEAGPSTTDCGSLSLPIQEGGTWQVRVTYASATTTLTSSTAEVVVP